MYHDLPSTASFWSFLLAVDEDLAETVRNRGCLCGGRLHSADYLRKPRGFPVRLTQLQCFRSSFCCDRDGCRKRATPPSTRFLGRKVYAGVIVILISAMRQGPTPRRVRELSERFGADLTTITRWQTFTLGEILSLPYSLVDTFLRHHPPREGWMLLLRFLSPITVAGGLSIKVS
jgi:hypothetical protein